MFLQKLNIFHFKNHSQASFEFSEDINCISGPNGSGKTNIADAIYFLANGKSYFNPSDSSIIEHNQDMFSIHGWLKEAEKETDILITFSELGKKNIKKNGKSLQRIIDLIGEFQTVFITPYDIDIILGNSDERRRFADVTISQTNKKYLETLSTHKKILEQRNNYLKMLRGTSPDLIIMESYDTRLAPLSQLIFEHRKNFVLEFTPMFLEYYGQISNKQESVSIAYQSQLEGIQYLPVLAEQLMLDVAAARTQIGVHKDDLVFELNGFPLKKYASQGQIKTYVLALKLAQYKYFFEKTGIKPILLLDDIFEKIDHSRALQLMQLVSNRYFGQIFITDTHADRVHEYLDSLELEKKYFSLV